MGACSRKLATGTISLDVAQAPVHEMQQTYQEAFALFSTLPDGA